MEREFASSTSQSTKRNVKVRRRLLREEKMMKTILIHLKSEAVNSARTRYTSCKRTDSSWWASQRPSQKISTSNKSSMIVSTARNSIITTELAILDWKSNNPTTIIRKLIYTYVRILLFLFDPIDFVLFFKKTTLILCRIVMKFGRDWGKNYRSGLSSEGLV